MILWRVLPALGALLVAGAVDLALRAGAVAPVAEQPWRDPAGVTIAPSIVPSPWILDFAAAENALMQPDASTVVKAAVDDQTEILLQQVCREIPAHASAEILGRVRTLILRLFPDASGERFARLVMQYYEYQQALTNLGAQGNDLAHLVALRHQYFGADVTEALFGSQQTLARYLLQREQIASDPALSAEQKQHALKTLQQHFSAAQSVREKG